MADGVYARNATWLPWVRGTEQGGLELVMAGGADALHDPREFILPIQAEVVLIYGACSCDCWSSGTGARGTAQGKRPSRSPWWPGLRR